MTVTPPSKQTILSSTTSLIPGSSGRPSTSSLAGYTSPNYSQGIGYSPSTPASPASSGIPSFRSLRSLLPFGPNKNATASASLSTPSPNNPPKSPFGAFGSVRRSMTKDRERKASLSNDTMMPPVIAIEKSIDDTAVIRRSVSLSKLDKPLPSEPSPSPSPCGDKLLSSQPLTHRTPSPGPLLSAELSTIIEADNSGVSKHITADSSPVTANHNAKPTQGYNDAYGSPTHEWDVDTSAMDLSTTHLADQVRDAIREGDSSKVQWSNADKAVIIDGDEHPDIADTAFNMNSVDRDLADILSPHSAVKPVPLQTNLTPNKPSLNPTTPNSPASPASRLPRARQASSFLPRLRTSNPSSSPSPQFPTHHAPSPPPATPKPSSSIVVNGNGYNTPKPSPSPALPSTSTPLRDRDGIPSLRVLDTMTTTVRDRASPIPRISSHPARMRKRSMSVQEKFGRGRSEDVVRSGSSLSTYGTKPSRGSDGGVESGSSVNESSASSGPKMEWLGPRTAKAFRAAGLLDFDREKERDREEGSEPTERLRDRSCSSSGVLSPSPLGIGNAASNLNRFASLRSASDYNPVYGRSHSRLTLSEVGSGVPRKGSEPFSAYGSTGSHGGSGGGGGSSYGHNGLMESPTFTVSSGSRERDTPKSSISTAPTSLADSFGYLGRDRSERDLHREREREREEMREMKEKHGTEMGALLGALSDSQRTVRVLREENSDLRDRLERFTVAVQANQELRQAYGDLQTECSNLERENVDLRKELAGLRGLTHSWSGGGNSSGSRTPVPKAAMSSSPLARTYTSRVAHEEYDDTFIDHGSEVENHHHPHYSSNKDPPDIILPPSSPVSSKKRRMSNSSSIFPIPPSNMTLLLHEDVTSTFGSIFSLPPPATSSQRNTHVQSQSSPPISYLNFAGNIPPNSSVTSIGSISPSTANFSMVTGSPGSLFLRPEHEILLGDMESLDLGVQGGDGEVVDGC